MKRMSAQKREEYENATQCYICLHAFEKDDPKGPMVRDDDHITEFFLCAAHRQCNLKRLVSFRIPVFFHNFRGYDAHLIVHEFGKRPERKIKVIGQNIKKYLQVEWGKTWSSATRCCSYLLPWTNSLPRSPRPAVKIFTISSRLSGKFTKIRKLSCSSKRASSATTTSTRSRGSKNLLYLHGKHSTILKAMSVRRPTTHTPSTYSPTSR